MVITYEEKDLSEVTHGLVNQLKPGDIVAFYGPLAAGKTTLIREIVQLLGYTGKVNSPTFVIEHRYKLNQKQILEVVHLDLYRLNSEDLSHFDWNEFSGKDKLALVEWPERAKNILPKETKKISIKKIDEITRQLTLSKNFND